MQIKKHGIHQLIVIGLIAHTCIEATVRFVAELGYEVTVVKDATVICPTSKGTSRTRLDTQIRAAYRSDRERLLVSSPR